MPEVDVLSWSEGLAGWQRDALRRIALSESLSEADRNAVSARLRQAYGIAVEGDTACVPLGAADLPAAGDADQKTILCSIGPLRHVNKLAPDQELPFAVDGITLIYGDNGSGKSGYARVAKKLCQARVVDDLLGNVFAGRAEPPAEVSVRCQVPGNEPQRENWQNGQPPLPSLRRMTVLDEASARVYIDKQNEITFLPREIEVITRFGELTVALGVEIQREADAIGLRYLGAYGGAYGATTAGRLVVSLITTTALASIPSERAIRDAAIWDQAKENELTALVAALSDDPRMKAAAYRRSAAALTAVVESLEVVDASIGDAAVAEFFTKVAEARTTAAAAALSAGATFAAEPLAQTGADAWRRMYAYARIFAEDAGLKGADEPFVENDPCPLCQRPLDFDATKRLERFDTFVRGRAAAEADVATRVSQEAIETINALRVPATEEIDRALAEYNGFGAAEVQRVASVRDFASAAAARRAGLLDRARNNDENLDDLGALPVSPAGALRGEVGRLLHEADALEREPAGDPVRVARVAELRDSKHLFEEIDAVLARRADLELRQRLLSCRASLDTAPISRFATRRRQELVAPDFRRRITEEIARLDLGHVPLRFEEASAQGRNLFDVALDTRQQAKKAAVLSEGEQRALGVACFLAEVGRVPGNHGIIVDDPVSSLDHQRIRRVAERLVEEASSGRQVIIFTHNLVFYQEVLSAAAASAPAVPVLCNLISKAEGGRFGLVTRDDEPWIAKKVTLRIEVLRRRLGAIPADINRDTDEYRRLAKDFYTDLRETWERLVEEMLLAGVVERFNSSVKTQSLKGVMVDNEDYRTIFVAMKRVSERSGHDMPAGRQMPVPDTDEMRRDLDAIDQYRQQIRARRNQLETERQRLERPPPAQVV